MKNNKYTILTPYFPTKANKYGGIFVFDQIKVFADLVEQVDVYVTRPWFKISRRFPFIKLNRDDLSLINIESANVTLKLIRYFPFPKDSILSHFSLGISIFLNKKSFSRYILAHTIYPLGVAANLAKLQPTIVVHGSDFRYFSRNKTQLKAIVATINKSQIICVSEGLKKEIENKAEIDTAKLKVIENGITMPNLPTYHQVISPDNKTFNFVFVGSLIKLKGVYELLYAFSELQNRTSTQGYTLTFVGDGIEKKGLEKLISLYNIKNITFLGAIENSKVAGVLIEKDCLVLPSYQEGFGRVIIEMLGQGKPVISTASGGPEYIINEDNGLIVPPQDSQALSSAMSQICLNYAYYKSEKIIKYVNENYNLVNQTIKLLDCVVMDVK